MSIDADNEQMIKQAIVTVVHESTGLHEHIAMPIAERVFDQLADRFGQERVYFTRSLRTRRERVLADFDGTNFSAVCRKHGISRRTLYRYIGGSG